MKIRLEAKRLSIGHQESDHSLCKDINFELVSGDLVMLMGRNGIGKSTLLSTLAGLIPPLAGEILINGKSLVEMNAAGRAKLISFVFSDVPAAGELKVRELLEFARYPHKNWYEGLGTHDRIVIRDRSSFMGIHSLMEKPLAILSDGQKKKAMITRALVQDTPIIYLDEPTAHLDLPSKIEIISSLRKMAVGLGKIIILSDHFWDISLMSISEMWLMEEGSLHKGAPEDFLLEDEIERLFSSGSHHVSKETGLFEFEHCFEQGDLLLQGDQPGLSWMKNFLSKEDYDFSSVEKIVASGNGFELYMKNAGKQTFPRLLDLRNHLKAL